MQTVRQKRNADTAVWVNGQRAGETHQGAFYRFHDDTTRLRLVAVQLAPPCAKPDRTSAVMSFGRRVAR